MFKKIGDMISKAFLGEKLFDFGVVVRNETKKNHFTEISMSINRLSGKRFVHLGIKDKNGGRTNYSWTRIEDYRELQSLKKTCEQIDVLLSSGLSDEDLKALNSTFPETETKI